MQRICRHLVLSFFAGLILTGCGLLVSSHHKIEDYKDIHAAAEAGDLEKAQQLLRADPKLIFAKDWENLTPLHLAVLHGHTNLVEFLLKQGAPVNAKTKAGITPLHFAAQTGNEENAKILIEHGANVLAIDNKGWRPIDRAQKWHHPKMEELLRKYGGNRTPPHFPGPKWLSTCNGRKDPEALSGVVPRIKVRQIVKSYACCCV